jgi:ribonuclease HII
LNPTRADVRPERRPAARPVRPSLRAERRLWSEGNSVVAGMDEVGRGAWAGPVSVGVAVVPTGATARTLPRDLRDSKQLAEWHRETVFDDVAAWCTCWAVGHASPAECDALGMTAALALAAARALSDLGVVPDALLVDGPRALTASDQVNADGGEPENPGEAAIPCTGELPATIVPVIGGDARCASIAAASVLAKVTRDRLMRDDAPHFPPFAFEHNKGYPSPVHQTALRGYGLTSIHRRSWRYVANLPWR